MIAALNRMWFDHAEKKDCLATLLFSWDSLFYMGLYADFKACILNKLLYRIAHFKTRAVFKRSQSHARLEKRIKKYLH